MADQWEPAKAVVKARRDSKKFAWSAMSTRSRYEYAMEITPSGGGAPFTTTMVTPMMVDRWCPLDTGDRVTVLCKSGTQEVKWDRNEPSTSRKARVSADQKQVKTYQDEAFEQALRSPSSGRK